jgi:hypothetical protein
MVTPTIAPAANTESSEVFWTSSVQEDLATTIGYGTVGGALDATSTVKSEGTSSIYQTADAITATLSNSKTLSPTTILASPTDPTVTSTSYASVPEPTTESTVTDENALQLDSGTISGIVVGSLAAGAFLVFAQVSRIRARQNKIVPSFQLETQPLQRTNSMMISVMTTNGESDGGQRPSTTMSVQFDSSNVVIIDTGDSSRIALIPAGNLSQMPIQQESIQQRSMQLPGQIPTETMLQNSVQTPTRAQSMRQDPILTTTDPITVVSETKPQTKTERQLRAFQFF